MLLVTAVKMVTFSNVGLAAITSSVASLIAKDVSTITNIAVALKCNNTEKGR